MTISPTSMVVLAIYAEIAVEILVLPVPSVASTRRLSGGTSGGPGREWGSRWRRVRAWSVPRKIALLWVPVAAGGALFCLPLALLLEPGLRTMSLTIPVLALPALRWPGLALAGAGRILALAAVRRLRSGGPDPEGSPRLQTRGIFRRSRNPIVVGMHLTYLGLFLAFPSGLLLAGFLVYAGSMHFRVLLEEDHLRHRFGEAYRRYRSSTRRYV